jgi:hypothetical protein
MMSTAIRLDDSQSVSDFRVLLQRAEKSTDGVIRLRADQGILRATVCTFAPFGLLDAAPTVLGMRTFAETNLTEMDALLSIRSLLDRLARTEPTETLLSMPATRETASWAGVDAPQGNWVEVAELAAGELTGVALAGIAEVAQALPENPGELIVREVRQQVWARELSGFSELTSASAFTAHMLGFLTNQSSARVYQSGRWLRLSTSSGHVLVYRR